MTNEIIKVGIDPSILSTSIAVQANGKTYLENFTYEEFVYGKNDKKKWFKLADEIMEVKTFKRYKENLTYSESEISKLVKTDLQTDYIVNRILSYDFNKDSIFILNIEGYSYSSSAGHIIDLVTFSSVLRKKLYEKVSTHLIVTQPTQLKSNIAKLCYEPIVKEIGGKNTRTEYIYKNNDGITGGRFKKKEILQAINDSNFKDDYATFVKNNFEMLNKSKNVPKPFEDCNDAYFLMKMID